METAGLRDTPSPAPAVTRAAALLQVLAVSGAGPLGLADLSRQLGLPKSSIANLCSALEEAGLVRRAAGGYLLGRRLLELGGAYLRSVDGLQDFHDLCRELRTISQETVLYATLDGTDVLYLARHDGTQPIRLASDVGRRLPANCTALGKAMLSQLDPAVVEERYRRLTAFPVLTAKSKNLRELMEDLDLVRARGYAVDDEENTAGVMCVALPLKVGDPREEPLHAASTTMLKARVDDQLIASVVSDLGQLVSHLSTREFLSRGEPRH